MSLSRDIKDYALEIGFDRVGITSAESFVSYGQELMSRHEMYQWGTEGPAGLLKFVEPENSLPGGKSIIVMVLDYFKQAFPENLVGKFGRLYQSRPFYANSHLYRARLELMKSFLRRCGGQVAERNLLPERLAAARAGVTNYGRNNFAYAGDSGSFIVLCSLVVDLELEYDEPTINLGCPEDCQRCLTACPTGALYAPLKMNPRKCITFNLYMPESIVPSIPYEIREKIGSWVYGCDICQEACPRNKPKLRAKLPPDPFLELLSSEINYRSLLNMTEDFYLKRAKPIAFINIKDKKYFQRNAAMAMGNSKDPEFVPDLERAMEFPEEIVRTYAAWALGRIGVSQARDILLKRLPLETSSRVTEEIKHALEMI
ncbi:MAG: epoxyqueuosine reductase [Bacillota bacterium]